MMPIAMIEPHQRIAPEAIFRQREGRHRAEQQHEEDRDDGDDQAVLEIADEIALPQHRLVTDKAEGRCAVGGASGVRKIAFRSLNEFTIVRNTGNRAISGIAGRAPDVRSRCGRGDVRAFDILSLPQNW